MAQTSTEIPRKLGRPRREYAVTRIHPELSVDLVARFDAAAATVEMSRAAALVMAMEMWIRWLADQKD